MSLKLEKAPVQSTPLPASPRRWKRDAAVDFFRGSGLWMIYLDHLDPNIWSHLTLWRFGFSDFAEVFIFLSGFMSVGSWERALSGGHAQAVFKKLGRRMARLYIAQIVSLLLSIAVLWAFAQRGVRVHDLGLYLWMGHPARYLVRVLALLYAPRFFTLLLLYIMVAPLLPLVVLGLKRAPKLTLGLSCGLWIASQFPRFASLGTSWHWYFNPLAWQFLFVLGAAVRYYSHALGPIGRSRWAVGTAAFLVTGSIALKSLALFPWILHRMSGGFQAILMHDSGKPDLAPYRLLHFLALLTLIYAFTSRHRGWLDSAVARWAIACGRDSLFIYGAGLVLCTAGDLVLVATGGGAFLQLVLSVTGIAVMCLLAWLRRGGRLTFKREAASDQSRNSME